MSTLSPTVRPQAHGTLPATDRGKLIEAQRLQQLGKMVDAEVIYRQVLQRHPGSFDALSSLGLYACALGRYEDGVTLLRAAISVDAKQADAYVNLGRALHRQGQHDSALAAVGMALEFNEGDDAARLEATSWLLALGRQEEARRWVEPMLQGPAEDAEASFRAGQALLALGDEAGALRSFQVASANGSNRLDALIRQGGLLAKAGRNSEADAAFARALALDGSAGAAMRGRCVALLSLGRPAEAQAWASKAVALEPNSVSAWGLQGSSLRALDRLDEACESFRRGLQIDSKHRPTVSGFGNTLLALHQYEDAALAFERLLAIWPDCDYAKSMLLHCKMLICDWLNFAPLVAAIEQDIDLGAGVAEPFGLQAYCDSPARLQRAAQIFNTKFHPDRSAESPLARAPLEEHKKIRIGYMSGEFKLQATLVLLIQLIELHDRSVFEVFAFDNGSADGSVYRQRIERAVDEIVSIAGCTDEEALQLIRDREIDILVNLNGFSGRARTSLFSLRPAPVQVNFLGFPGTLGVPYMDYLIADPIVIPEADRCYYDEAIVYLPDSYQPNDDRRAIADDAMSRRACGLPESAFVFCCFNNAYRITPEVFSVWMRLLSRVPGSVIWLLELVEESSANLVQQAQSFGIAANRLVFAKHVPIDQHLSRLRLADLVLDTLPYNAHTTGSDALWVGVPMVTCLGNSFPGRVGASLLSAVGMPDLIAQTLAEYEALALRLATSPPELAAIRERLGRNRDTTPLFDTQRYRLHIEAAFKEMVSRARLGLAPSLIEVFAPVPSSASALPAMSLPAGAPPSNPSSTAVSES